VRREKIDLIVSHWTGGEGDPDRVGETLRARKLGIEWSLSRAGEVWQHCDPVYVDTADVGLLNYRSGGIEVVCYGFAGGWTIDPVRAVRVPLVPRLGKDRETYAAMTHGRRVVTAKPYPAQMDAWLGLCTTISAALGVPKQVPPPEYDDQVFPLVLDTDPLTRFKGHIAHYHATTKKRDIGPWPIQQLRQHFAGRGVV
jgi:hypothetical protein